MRVLILSLLLSALKLTHWHQCCAFDVDDDRNVKSLSKWPWEDESGLDIEHRNVRREASIPISELSRSTTMVSINGTG